MIEIKNVTKTYNPGSRNANTVLKNASLTLPDHGLICIVGKSGIGKSTILNAIGGLMSFDGEILYDGKKENIETYRRKNIGYIFQDFLLFPQMSVKDNIRIGLEIAGIYDEKETLRRTKILLKAVGLNINPNRSAGALSLGQRQRVSIARALASNPKTILCDEPTGNLDSKNSMNIMRILKALSKDHLIIVVTHNVNLVHVFADKAYAIENATFHEINPKEGKVDEIYVKSQINISKLTRKDIQSEHILLKLYSDPNCPEKEISIIVKDGKVLIVGDNVEVADKSEVQLVEQEQEEKKEENPDESEEEFDGLQALNSESFRTRPTFKDTGFYRELVSIIHRGKNRRKGQRRKRFALVMEVLIPISIFTTLSFALGIKNLFLEMYGSYTNINNMVGLVSDGSGNGITKDQYLEMIEDKETNHIIDLAQDNGAMSVSTSIIGNAYNTGNTVSQSYPGNSNIGSYDGYYDDYYDDDYYGSSYITSSTTNSVNKKNYSLYISIGNCSILKESSTLIYKNSSKEAIFNDIDAYEKIVPSLSKYDLKDNEIVLDTTIGNYLFADIEFASGTWKDHVIDSTIKVTNTKERTDYTTYETFVVKGVEDTGFSAIYATNEVTASLRLSNYCLASYLPDAKDYEILNYDDIKNNTDYTFSSNISSDAYTGAEDSIHAYLSPEAKAALYKYGSYNGLYGIYLDNVYADLNVNVTKTSEPNKKIIVLRDYTDMNSYEEFFRQYFAVSVYNNSYVAQDMGDDDVKLPKALYDVFTSSIVSTSLEMNDENLKNLKISFYDSDNKFDKIRLSENGYQKLLGNHYSDLSFNTISTYFTASNTDKQRKAKAYSNHIFVITDDINKTISYFKDRVNDYHLEAHSVSEAREANLDELVGELLAPEIYSVLFMALIFTIILAVDSTSRINKEKYRFGVLRSLGMPRSAIILDEIQKATVRAFFCCLIPTLCLVLVQYFFRLFFLSWYYLLFLAGYYVIVVLSFLIPLLFVLRKKPIDILHTLN